MKLLRLVSLAAVVMGLAFASQASAATVYWGGSAGTVVGPRNVLYGPYQLQYSPNGPKFDAVCITAPLSVSPPSDWTANVYTGISAPDAVTYTGSTLLDKNGVPTTTGEVNIDLTDLKLQQAWALTQKFYDTGADKVAIHSAIMSLFTHNAGLGYTAGDYLTGLTPADGGSFNVIVGQKLQMQSNNEYGPQIFLTKTPEPCSLVLLGLGMAAVGIVRRRRKA